MKTALVLGRFHAVTSAQADWLQSLGTADVERIVCVITSADHRDTKRNPLPVATRELLVRPALARSGKPFDIVPINDIAESERWVAHVVESVKSVKGVTLTPAETQVFTSNHDVGALFSRAGFHVIPSEAAGLTPNELLEKILKRADWQKAASPETIAVFSDATLLKKLEGIFGQTVTTADGELGHKRDFNSYGAQMDASLRQKLDDLLKWVVPGCIVDQGCGTGKLMVELSHQFPDSKLVGVDLSREFLRRCDQNTYSAEDVRFVNGNVIDLNVAPASATTVIYSSVMHEVHSYTGYNRDEIHRALKNCFTSLQRGGRVLIRDGISPLPATWRLTFLDEPTAATFAKFAREFRHNQGVTFRQLAASRVELSAHDANEFLCKKDYLTNWHIEVHEEFGPFTLPEWKGALEKAGFKALHLAEYCNEWILKNRYEGHVTLTDVNDAPLAWPATNCVVVGEK